MDDSMVTNQEQSHIIHLFLVGGSKAGMWNYLNKFIQLIQNKQNLITRMIDQNIIILLKYILLQLKSLLSSVSHNVGCLAGHVDLLPQFETRHLIQPYILKLSYLWSKEISNIVNSVQNHCGPGLHNLKLIELSNKKQQ